MTKRKICGLLSGVMLTTMLSGCGDGSEEAGILASGSFGMPEAVQMEMTTVLAQAEQSPSEIKLLYNTGKLTAEEEAAILETMESLYRNLEVEEYLGESIHMVSSEEWFETMTPRLYEGCRSYTLQQGETVLLSVQVGYDISGAPYSNVCYQAAEDSISLLKQSGSKLSLLQTGLSDGEYDGAFVFWQFDSAQGEIKKEEGTYSQGILVGEYSVSVCQGVEGEAFELWTNRETFGYETETVTYDEQGQPVAEATPEPTATPTKTPAPTKKPAAATPKPTQAPTAAPTQPPANNNDDSGSGGGDSGGSSGGSSGGGDSSGSSGGSSGGGDSGGSSGGSSGGGDSGGSSGGSSGGGDSGGSSDSGSGGGDSGSSGPTEGDTDIDWSPDLLE